MSDDMVVGSRPLPPSRGGVGGTDSTTGTAGTAGTQEAGKTQGTITDSSAPAKSLLRHDAKGEVLASNPKIPPGNPDVLNNPNTVRAAYTDLKNAFIGVIVLNQLASNESVLNAEAQPGRNAPAESKNASATREEPHPVPRRLVPMDSAWFAKTSAFAEMSIAMLLNQRMQSDLASALTDKGLKQQDVRRENVSNLMDAIISEGKEMRDQYRELGVADVIKGATQLGVAAATSGAAAKSDRTTFLKSEKQISSYGAMAGTIPDAYKNFIQADHAASLAEKKASQELYRDKAGAASESTRAAFDGAAKCHDADGVLQNLNKMADEYVRANSVTRN